MMRIILLLFATFFSGLPSSLHAAECSNNLKTKPLLECLAKELAILQKTVDQIQKDLDAGTSTVTDESPIESAAKKTTARYIKVSSSGQPLPDTAATWGCVYDAQTKLLWDAKSSEGWQSYENTYTWYNPLLDAEHQGVRDGGQCVKTAPGLESFSIPCDTLGYTTVARAMGLCGYYDWRLSSVDDLKTLFSPYGDGGFMLYDSRYFLGIDKQKNYWVSSVYTTPNFAWSVDFSDAVGHAIEMKTDQGVRLVRGTLAH